MTEKERLSSLDGLRLSRTLQSLDLFCPARISIDESTLVVEEGPHKGAQVPLDRDLLYVGRADWCDLPLPKDKHVSSVHCELRVEEGGIRLLDRGSRNGCYLGDNRVFDALLVPGSKFRVGATHCVLRVDSEKKKEIDVHFVDESGQLVGQHPKIREIFVMIQRLASKEIAVLFTGETGTGKSSIVQALHAASGRKGNLVVVNCGALSPSLIESELFGYEKGAFTGASGQHEGYFEQARGGTLFLDEIGELPMELQPKLLDVLERKRLRRLGGKKEIAVDFRFVSATHQHLEGQVREGLFREDLFYRLAVVELEVPALRDRREDIPLIVAHLLSKLEPKRLIEVTPAATRTLQEHYWPGNIRELRNVMERSLLLLEGDKLDSGDLMMPRDARPLKVNHGHRQEAATSGPSSAEVLVARPQSPQSVVSMKDQLADAERQIIAATLDTLGWNVSQAAQALEVSRSWLHGRIKSYNLQRPTS